MVRLQQNLPLKMISLITSIMLYFFVQSERNPALSRPMNARVVLLNVPADADVESDLQSVPVMVMGPRSIVDRIKEGDIRVVADLKNVAVTGRKSVALRYDKSLLPDDQQAQIVLDPLAPTTPLHVQIFPLKTRTFPITPLYSKTPRPGFIYGSPDIKPAQVKVTGRAERVDQIKRLVVIADPVTPGSEIDEDFEVTARDKDNNAVENVTIMPDHAHIRVSLRDEPYPKIVTVSPNIVDQPPPGYRLLRTSVTPNQLKVAGRPEDVQPISTITTTPISIGGFTHTQTIEVSLHAPPKVTVSDLSNKAVTNVKIHIELEAVPRLGPTPTDPNAVPTDKPGDGSGTVPDPLTSPLNPKPKNTAGNP